MVQELNVKSVLVVDDEKDLGNLLKDILIEEGYRVEFYSCPLQALVKARGRESLDVLITDFDMPGLNGDEVAKKMREIHPRVQIIMLTASSNDLRKLVAGGVVNKLFKKPFELDDVVYTVNELARNGHSRTV